MWQRLSTEYLAAACARRPKRTILIWLVVLVAGFASVFTFVEGTMTTEFFFFGNPESKKADTLLEDRLRGPADVNEVVLLRSANMTVDDAAYQERVITLFDEIAGLGDEFIASITNYYQSSDESLVSEDRRTTIIPLVMSGRVQRGRDQHRGGPQHNR